MQDPRESAPDVGDAAAPVGRCAHHPERPAALQCTRCGDNLCDTCAGERIDGVCKPCLERLAGRGKVWQLEWLAVVTMVHASLMLLWSAGLGVLGLSMGWSVAQVPAREGAPPSDLMAGVLGGTTLFMMLGQLVPAVLQLASGWFMLRHRYRTLAIFAYLSGVLSISGCYCLPTSILLAVWGLVVLFDRDVTARFAATS